MPAERRTGSEISETLTNLQGVVEKYHTELERIDQQMARLEYRKRLIYVAAFSDIGRLGNLPDGVSDHRAAKCW